MRFTPLDIAGACLVELTPNADERGSFARTFCAREFAAQGLPATFVQHSRSFNRTRGTIRGMHFQCDPSAEDKLVTCTRGAIFDVCLDLRSASPTYRQWRAFELSEDNGRQLLIPKGCAHGFQTLTDDAEVYYLISEYYAPSASGGVRFDDPAFAIAWPVPASVISDKDRGWPAFRG